MFNDYVLGLEKITKFIFLLNNKPPGRPPYWCVFYWYVAHWRKPVVFADVYFITMLLTGGSLWSLLMCILLLCCSLKEVCSPYWFVFITMLLTGGSLWSLLICIYYYVTHWRKPVVFTDVYFIAMLLIGVTLWFLAMCILSWSCVHLYVLVARKVSFQQIQGI